MRVKLFLVLPSTPRLVLKVETFDAPVVFPWVSLVFPGPLWAYLAFSSLLLAYMGLYGPLWASLAVSGQSPKLPTHTHKKHTETFHKLPTTRVHPEKGTIKKTNPDD